MKTVRINGGTAVFSRIQGGCGWMVAVHKRYPDTAVQFADGVAQMTSGSSWGFFHGSLAVVRRVAHRMLAA